MEIGSSQYCDQLTTEFPYHNISKNGGIQLCCQWCDKWRIFLLRCALVRSFWSRKSAISYYVHFKDKIIHRQRFERTKLPRCFWISCAAHLLDLAGQPVVTEVMNKCFYEPIIYVIFYLRRQTFLKQRKARNVFALQLIDGHHQTGQPIGFATNARESCIAWERPCHLFPERSKSSLQSLLRFFRFRLTNASVVFKDRKIYREKHEHLKMQYR